ncbi:hypothetical protein NS226_13295 [Aureimonas ureilytica]|uniref:Leucine-binding protein domain-containing protein n=1 Tax=Aureimonas ureilytica TaxID=401562 RepID=A0A175R754_9HYPH|nr:ABC transporter substrate-binding protein [Aureimonas ureilytica]KTQ95152.1 hypothetical protein NS226_13295 [Aureimonas ureilytica]
MTLPPRIVLATLLMLLPKPSIALADGIAVAVPLSGPNAILGRQAVDGARAAVDGSSLPLADFDTGCERDAGREVAEKIVAARAEIAVGFLCTSALEGALPVLSAAGIPTLDIGARSDRILARREHGVGLIWRLAPGPGAEAAAVASFVRARWNGEPFGIVEDGSSYGSDLAEAVRGLLEAQGLRPTLVDNFRPAEEKQFGLARRIAQSGLRHVLVFGTRRDVAIVARDALDVNPGLQIASGESLLDEPGDVPLPDGVLTIASGFDVGWVPSETAPADEGYARIARIGTEIAIEALRRAKAENRTLKDLLDAETFVTSGGLVRFDAQGSADVVPFQTYRWQSDRFVTENQG